MSQTQAGKKDGYDNILDHYETTYLFKLIEPLLG